jgi:hypothetical protein
VDLLEVADGAWRPDEFDRHGAAASGLP